MLVGTGNSTGHSDMISDGNEKHSTGNQRKGSPCYNMAKKKKKLADLYLCSGVLQKVELVSNEIGQLAEKTSKKDVEGVA